MRKLVPGVLTIALGMGLVACGNDEEESAVQDPALSAPPIGAESSQEVPRQENEPAAVPAEPVEPSAQTPSEPPDAGVHGIEDGAMLPGNEMPGNEMPGTDGSGDRMPTQQFTPQGVQPAEGETIEGADETVPAEPPQ